MSRVRLILATSMLSLPLPSFGQGWIEYVSMTDRFGMYVPGEPEVRDIAYPSEYGVVFPARLYLYEDPTIGATPVWRDGCNSTRLSPKQGF